MILFLLFFKLTSDISCPSTKYRTLDVIPNPIIRFKTFLRKLLNGLSHRKNSSNHTVWFCSHIKVVFSSCRQPYLNIKYYFLDLVDFLIRKYSQFKPSFLYMFPLHQLLIYALAFWLCSKCRIYTVSICCIILYSRWWSMYQATL